MLADFAVRGVEAYAVACDVADRRALETLFENIGATMPPIVGILHAAMVLDDGLISNLDEERFDRVLAPKVKGADNLDSAHARDGARLFRAFFIGDDAHGQSRAGELRGGKCLHGGGRSKASPKLGSRGLRSGGGRSRTSACSRVRSGCGRGSMKLTGVRGMRASEALDLMAQALEQPSAAALAVITISPTEGLFTADRLKVLGSPTYANLVAGAQARR